MKKLTLLLGMCWFLVWHNLFLWADVSQPQRMPTIKVKGITLPLSSTRSDNLHFAAPELSNIDFVSRVLIKQKSLQVVEQGPPGMLSNMFIRGSKSIHNAVIIDGIKMNSSSDGGGYDFSQTLVDDYSDVTVAPNPSYQNQSHATGGSILLTTKQGRGKPTTSATLEHSTHPSQKINVQTQGGYKDNDLFLSVTNFQSGQGRQLTLRHNMIADKYHLQTLTANLGFAINPKFSVRTITHWQSSNLKLNEYQGDLPYASNNRLKNDKYDATVMLGYKTDDNIKHQLLLTQAQKKFSFTDLISPKITNQQNILIYNFEWNAAKYTAFKIMFENHWERYQSARQIIMNNNPKFINIGIDDQLFDNRFKYQLSMRYHRLYDNKTYCTYQSTARYKVYDDIELKLGYGTGIRAPNMAERYGNPPYQLANLQLSPEKSHNFDVGIQSQFFDKRLLLDINFFHNIIDHFITFTAIQPNVYKNFNSQKRMTRGVELFSCWMLDKKLKLELSYTYIDALDSQTQRYPLRLARHKFSSDVVLSPIKDWNFYAGIFYKSSQTDKIFSSIPNINLKGYATLHGGFLHRINDHIDLTGRIDNLLNCRYENVYGFGSSGTEIFLTLKAKL